VHVLMMMMRMFHSSDVHHRLIFACCRISCCSVTTVTAAITCIVSVRHCLSLLKVMSAVAHLVSVGKYCDSRILLTVCQQWLITEKECTAHNLCD